MGNRGMMGMQGIRVEMQRIRVGMQGMGVGMWEMRKMWRMGKE